MISAVIFCVWRLLGWMQLKQIRAMEPTSNKMLLSRGLQNFVKQSVASSVLLQTALTKASTADGASSLEGLYTNNIEKFALIIPPSWVTNARKTVPGGILSKYGVEDLLLTATSVAEGASLGVTRSDARRLLKDFQVEWWFADLDKIEDLGTAELLAGLLILQRQGAFEKKETRSELTSAKYVGEANGDKNSRYLLFSFNTPIVEGVNRSTLAKAYYYNNALYVIWLSSLESVMQGEYGGTIQKIVDSFTLV